MSPSVWFRWSGWLLFVIGSTCCAQPPKNAQPLINEKLVSGDLCKGLNLQQEGYTIDQVTLRGPLEVSWLFKGAGSAQERLQSTLSGKQFTYGGAVTDQLEILRGSGSVPLGAAGAFRISVAFIVATRCDHTAKTVDLAYNLYTIPPASLMSGTPEWQNQAEKAPQDAIGLTARGNPFHFTPHAFFNGWKQLSSGGHLSWQRDNISVVADGAGSASEYQGSLALSGSKNSLGSIAQWNWRLNGNIASLPVSGGQLARNQFVGQLAAATRPFAGGNLMARFGGQIEGGDLRSTLTPAQLAANTIANGIYVSTRLYGGLTSRASHNLFSASVGTELGFVMSSDGYWRKIVADVTDDFWKSMPNHHPLEFETRVTGGAIPSFQNIPSAARFYGGSAVTPFVPGDDWQINGGPLIRGIAAGQLSRTAAGAGAQSFVSANLTVSWPVWVVPLVPPVVGREIGPLIEGQLVTAQSLLQNSYAAEDPGVKAMLDLADSLASALNQFKMDVAAVHTADPGRLQTESDSCSDGIVLPSLILAGMAAETDKYTVAKSMPGYVSNLMISCSALLGQEPADAAVQKDAMKIDGIAEQIAAADLTLQAAAKKKAMNDTQFASRAVKTVVNDFNVISIAPVAIADWARIGPSGNGFKADRFGPGAGIRVELATYVNFTAGLAFNIHPQPGEGARAFYFSIGFRDLLH